MNSSRQTWIDMNFSSRKKYIVSDIRKAMYQGIIQKETRIADNNIIIIKILNY